MAIRDLPINLNDPASVQNIARIMWTEGFLASDALPIMLCYGFTEAETSAICKELQSMEKEEH